MAVYMLFGELKNSPEFHDGKDCKPCIVVAVAFVVAVVVAAVADTAAELNVDLGLDTVHLKA